LLRRAFQERALSQIVIGLLPLLAWLVFALLYYGDFLPNTAGAKLGVYSLDEGIRQGLVYLVDWAYYEPASVLALLACAALTFHSARAPAQRLLLLGCGLYVAYVVVIGGDFMRGRFLLPVFVTSCYLGVFTLSRLISAYESAALLCTRPLLLALAAFVALTLVAPAQTARIPTTGIVNEREYYAGLHLDHYLKTRRLVFPFPEIFDPTLLDQMHAFRDACGPFAVHAPAIGGFGYLSGSAITLIDTHGLTDRYIAGLDDPYLLDGKQRPGHPRRLIPIAYLASRGDIAIFSDWREALVRIDCAIIEAARSYAADPSLFNPYAPGSQPSFYLAAATGVLAGP
jgi:arabinofuranosyltransferase